MPRKTYTIPQKAAKRAVEDAYNDYRNAKADLRREIEAALEEQLRAKLYLVSRKANEAIHLGVTKTDIKVAVRNGNWESLKNLLAMTIHEFDGSVVVSTKFAMDGDPFHPELWPNVTACRVQDDAGFTWEAIYGRGKSYVEWRDVNVIPIRKERSNFPLDGKAPEWLQWLYEQDSWKMMIEEVQ